MLGSVWCSLVFITTAENGCGIPEKDLERLKRIFGLLLTNCVFGTLNYCLFDNKINGILPQRPQTDRPENNVTVGHALVT